MKLLLRICAIILFLMCLFPPWVQEDHHGVIRGSEPLGYSWIFRPPQPIDRNSSGDPSRVIPEVPVGYEEISEDSYARKGISVRMDLPRLFFEILALVALVGLSLTFTRKTRT